MSMIVPAYPWILALPLTAAAMLIAVPVRNGDPHLLSPAEIGFLGGGPFGAVRAALASLRIDGLAEPGRRGWRRTGTPIPRGGDRLDRAVYRALYTDSGPRALSARASVREELLATEARLAAAGLVPGRARRLGCLVLLAAALVLGAVELAREITPRTVGGLAAGGLGALLVWWLSPRTVAGRRALRRLRAEYTRGPAARDENREPTEEQFDAVLRGGAPMATGRVTRRKKAVALGLVGVITISTVPADGTDAHWTDLYDFDGAAAADVDTGWSGGDGGGWGGDGGDGGDGGGGD